MDLKKLEAAKHKALNAGAAAIGILESLVALGKIPIHAEIARLAIDEWHEATRERYAALVPTEKEKEQ